jgi:serine/threonine protein kinase
MSPEQWARVKELFNEAMERAPQERSAFLVQACADDLPLRTEIESLLNATATEFMERPAVEVAAGLMARDRSESLIGSQLNHYQILSVLGTGGMADVYRARDAKLNRDVAIKVLPRAFARDRDRLSRFHREARLLASLNHPHIAAIYGFEEDAKVSALVLELAEGETLAERISHGPVPVQDALAIGRQIAEALGAAHAKDIVHRDLKPANIKITPEGVVKVLDFGLAKMFGTSTPAGLYATPAFSTDQNVILGTISYMSPEQACGKTVDRRTDVWAWGCVMYEMLTGRRPFQGDLPTDLLTKIASAEPDWSRLSAAVPSSIRALLRRCLEKEPNHRPHDVAALQTEIDQAKIPRWRRVFKMF